MRSGPAVISNPLEVIEQITYLLFLRRLDDLHTLEENRSARLKEPIARGARFTIPTPALLAKVVDLLDNVPREGSSSPRIRPTQSRKGLEGLARTEADNEKLANSWNSNP